MHKKILFFLLFNLSAAGVMQAQFFGQIPEPVKYKASEVMDPEYGIKMYERLNFATGGDSVRNDKKGYACQGWIQDLYESGAVLHKGYYEDGVLKNYKNFFENGTVERAFKIIDFKKSSMQIFYPDGTKKVDMLYYEGAVMMETDYFPNGQIEYLEENTKSMEYLVQRKTYQQNGNPVDLMELTDPKKKVYSKKEYYENGKIKAEGTMRFSRAMIDYQKDGTWKVYDANGNMKLEKWANGELLVE